MDSSHSHSRFSLLILAVLLSMTSSHSFADDDPDCKTKESEACLAEQDSSQPLPLAGPEQVENRLHIDANRVSPLFPSDFGRGYFDWKERVKEENGVGFGGDYSFAYLSASESLGDDDAFSGMYRMFGTWEATSDGRGNSGALIWKVEHRHAYGSNIAPGSLGLETGYIDLHLPPCRQAGPVKRRLLVLAR